MKVHTLKVGEPDYTDIVSGRKRFEVRQEDEDFREGDLLMLCQYVNKNFTGLDVEKKIGYIQRGCPGLEAGWAVLGLEDVENAVDSSDVAVRVQREGFDFLSRTMFGDCPHCGEHITKDKSPDRCAVCGRPILWGEDKFSAL